MTERVVEATSSILVVDLTLDDGSHKKTARARYSRESGALSELLSASLLDPDHEKQLTPGAFEAMMSATAFSADDNDGEIASKTVTVAVAGQRIDCTQTSYRVSVGGGRATLKMLTSDVFPWGDVGGEITTKDGNVLYRAEVVDAGNARPVLAASR
jgi:hypothetical protein